MKRFVCAVLAALLMSVLVMTASAEETEARNIFGNSILKAHTGFRDVDELIDGNTVAPMALGDNTSMTLQHPEGIGSMYMIFNKEYGPFPLPTWIRGRSGLSEKTVLSMSLQTWRRLSATHPQR